jgi:hypothetical protein
VLIRVQVRNEIRLPVSGGSAPAFWALLLRCFIDDGALLQQRDINPIPPSVCFVVPRTRFDFTDDRDNRQQKIQAFVHSILVAE